jgi:hypothetical protein
MMHQLWCFYVILCDVWTRRDIGNNMVAHDMFEKIVPIIIFVMQGLIPSDICTMSLVNHDVLFFNTNLKNGR